MTRRPKGSGTIERTRDGRWRARFPLPDERVEVGVFSECSAAAEALDAYVVELGEHAPQEGTTLAAWWPTVEKRRGHHASIGTDRDRWNAYLEPWECARWALRAIGRRQVRAWLDDLRSRGLAVQTRRNALNLLRAILAEALEDELVELNPCDGVKVKGEGRTDEPSTWLTAPEAARFLAAITDPIDRTMVAFAIGTGLRQGEQRSLRWPDVHEDHVVVRYGKPGKSTKSGKVRRVPLLPQVQELIAGWRKVCPPSVTEKVFPSARGVTRCAGHMIEAETWRAYGTAAKVDRPFRWHDLRHTCATLLLTGELDGRAWTLEEVKDMLGHASITTTERYARSLGAAMRANRKPDVSPQTSSRLRDLNSRPTVYEVQDGAQGTRDEEPESDPAAGLCRAYLEHVEAGRTEQALVTGVRLVERVLAERDERPARLPLRLVG